MQHLLHYRRKIFYFLSFLNCLIFSLFHRKKQRGLYLENLFANFLEKTSNSNDGFFQRNHGLFQSKTGRFNISVFESIFVASCTEAFRGKKIEIEEIDFEKVNLLKNHDTFIDATQSATASEKNVKARISLATEILK